MMDSIQTSVDRKALRSLGATLRIGGGALVLTGIWGILNNAQDSNLGVATRTAFMAFGLRAMTTMASDCITAAKHARNPIGYARSSLKLSPVSAVFWLAASYTIGSWIPHPTQAPAIESIATENPSATNDALKNAKIIKNPDCTHGNSVITFDEKTKRSIIMECTGPLTFRQGG